MGLLNQVLGHRQSTSFDLSPAEAYAAITIVAIASDGCVADDKIDLINTSLMRMQLFKNYSRDLLRTVYEKLSGILRRDGVSNLLSAAKSSLPLELRESVFAVATDLILADKTVTREEQSFLDDLCQVLEINQDKAVNIVEIMLIKNLG
jgi:hypothetical protein